MRQTLRVIEHERIQVGVPIPTTTGALRALTITEFDALVRFDQGRPDRIFDVGHRTLKFRNQVGFLQVGELGIEILPKVDRTASTDEDRGRWHDALVRMLRVAHRLPVRSTTDALLARERGSLLDVFVELFLDEVERIAREGLVKTYRTEESNLNSFKGRLVVREQIRKNLVHAERFYVERSVYDVNNPHNRVLAAALHALGGMALPSILDSRRRAVANRFGGVNHRSYRSSDLHRIPLGRKTERYRLALEVARMILMNHTPRLRAGDADLLALVFDMNALWESYVAIMLRRAVGSEYDVRTQESRPFWAAGRRHSQVRPDLVLRSKRPDGETIVIDTKWKVPHDGRPDAGDLKQMFAYNEFFNCAASWLLYPTEKPDPKSIRGEFNGRDHRCGTAYLSALSADPIAEIRAMMTSMEAGILRT